MPLFHRRTPEKIEYDPARQRPAARVSICTGETTVGFLDRQTGAFTELCRVEGREGVADFCRRVGARPEDVKTIY